MANDPKDEAYSEAEATARREATLKVMLATPHKPHKPRVVAPAAGADDDKA